MTLAAAAAAATDPSRPVVQKPFQNKSCPKARPKAQCTSTPAKNASKVSCPLQSTDSAAAKTAGHTTALACTMPSYDTSSKSSTWDAVPFTNAAASAEPRLDVPSTVQFPDPYSASERQRTWLHTSWPAPAIDTPTTSNRLRYASCRALAGAWSPVNPITQRASSPETVDSAAPILGQAQLMPLAR